MIKEGSKVIVHIYDSLGHEIATRKFGEALEVVKRNGQLGINWNDSMFGYENVGSFASFESFSDGVVFEDAETHLKYHYSTIAKSIVANTTE